MESTKAGRQINLTLKTAYLDNKKLEPSEIDNLLALAMHKKIEYLYKNPRKIVSRSTFKKFNHLLKKRLAGWSESYLKGYKEFFGLRFLVNKHTLIPRPDSEILVEEVLKNIKKNHKVIDVGTGSGCLVISIAKNFPQAKYFATDISKKALQAARTNTRRHKVHITFFNRDLLKNIDETFDIVIANLPYLSSEQMKEESIKKEPETALLGGKDGLDYYKRLLAQIKKNVSEHGQIYLEIDPSQEESISKLIKKHLPKGKVEFLKDLSKLVRVAKITL